MKLAAVTLLLPTLALAEERVFADFRGWTEDSRSVAYVIREMSVSPESGEESLSVTGYVVDARTGESKKLERKAIGEIDAWIAAHPVKELPGCASPDGNAKARIDLSGEDAKSGWKEATFTFGCADAETCMMTDGRMRSALGRSAAK